MTPPVIFTVAVPAEPIPKPSLAEYQHINPVWFSNALTHSHDQSGGFQFIQRTLDRHGAAGQDCGNGCDREADKQDSVLVLLSVG